MMARAIPDRYKSETYLKYLVDNAPQTKNMTNIPTNRKPQREMTMDFLPSKR
jgi:hypothetical protein